MLLSYMSTPLAVRIETRSQRTMTIRIRKEREPLDLICYLLLDVTERSTDDVILPLFLHPGFRMSAVRILDQF
jgi:hypothetical protein